MNRFFILFPFLLLPFFAFAQVEKVSTFTQWEVHRLFQGSEAPLFSMEDELSITVGDRLIYRAFVGTNPWQGRQETWLIDQNGNRQVFPDVGKLLQMDNGRVLSLLQNRIAALDPVTLARTLLFDETARVLGRPQNGRVLAVTQYTHHGSLWSIDGSPGGNRLLLDTVQVAFGLQNHRSVFELDGLWAFLSTDRKVILTDGTEAGTRILHHFDQDIEIIGLTPQYVILYRANQLWSLRIADGQLTAIYNQLISGTASRGAYPNTRAQINGRALFVLRINDAQHALWSSDGTMAGTRQLTFVPDRAIPNQNNGLYVIGDKAYYLNRGYFDSGGWETDGTVAGTRRFAGEQEGLMLMGQEFKWDADRVLFTALGAHQYSGLWMLHEGKLKDCTPWPGYGAGLQEDRSWLRLFHTGEHHVYYQAFGPGLGRELFRTDKFGRSEPVADLSPGMAWSDVVPIGQAGPWFYFVMNHPGGGASLYRVRDDQPVPAAPTPVSDFYTWQDGLSAVIGRNHIGAKAIADDLAIGTDGDVYVTGTYDSPHGLTAFNGRQFTQPLEADVLAANHSGRSSRFLARFRGADGEPAWMVTLGNHLSPNPLSKIAKAPGNGVYLSAFTSAFQSPLRIGNESFDQLSHTIIARLDSAGQLLWNIGGAIRMVKMETDPQGNLIAGIDLAWSEATLGGKPFDNPRGLPSTGSHWAIAKIQPDGTVAWAQLVAPKSSAAGESTLKSMVAGADGRNYLLFSTAGEFPAENPCEASPPVSVRVVCLSAAGTVVWERSYQPGSGVVPTGMAVNEQGMAYLCGFSKGDVQFGALKRNSSCDIWQSFVLTLNRNGLPLELHFLEDEDLFAYGIAMNEEGRYALTGVTGAPPAPIPYTGFSDMAPYDNRVFRQFFVRYHSITHQLLDEKNWYQAHNAQGPIREGQNFIRMAHYGHHDFIYMNTYSGPIDTFAHAPALVHSTGTMLMRLPLSAPPLPPLLDNRPLSASDIQVFPNPAAHSLTLYSEHADFPTAPLRLFNSIGQHIPIADITAFGPYRYLDLSDLPTGVYFLGVLKGNKWEVKRIVVQR